MKKIISLTLSLVLVFSVTSCSNDEVQKLKEEKAKIEKELKECKESKNELQKKYNELEKSSKPYIEKLEKEKKEKEEKSEEKEYESGITYEQFVRYPDKNNEKMFKFEGKVIEVFEDEENFIGFKILVDYKQKQPMMLGIEKKLVKKRIMKNDKIEVFGISKNLMDYTSDTGEDIKIPSGVVQKYKIK